VSSFDPSEVVVHEREYRRERRGRDYSPPESPQRYEHFRYVEGAPQERYERLDRTRSRSRAREYEYEPEPQPRGSYRETSTRIRINEGRGGRSAEYRR
jgi:hypothetical protein